MTLAANPWAPAASAALIFLLAVAQMVATYRRLRARRRLRWDIEAARLIVVLRRNGYPTGHLFRDGRGRPELVIGVGAGTRPGDLPGIGSLPVRDYVVARLGDGELSAKTRDEVGALGFELGGGPFKRVSAAA